MPVFASAARPASSGGKTLCYFISGVLVIALIALGFMFSQTSGKLNTANTRITSLQSDVAAKQVNIDGLNTQLTAEKANVASLQTQLATAQAGVTKLTSDLATSQASLTAAQGQIRTIQASLDTATASVTKLTSDLSTANAKVATTQASLYKAAAYLTKATADLAAANASLTSSQAQLTNIQAHLTALQAKSPPKAFPDLPALQAWITNNMPLITAAATSTSFTPILSVQNKALSDGWIVFAAILPTASGSNIYLQAYVASNNVYFISLGTSPGTVIRAY
jgi:peptidoglycan hydrolase CwlO-like protein